MIKELTDIVTRSKQIADLENSDYISDSEMQFLLNEAYDSVYADLINIGDRYFIVQDEFDGQTYSLPENFMVLSGIWSNYTPIPRKVNTMADHIGLFYYELNKDHITVQGTSVGHCKLEYYPTLEPIVWPIQYDEEDPTVPITPTTIDLPNNICFNYFCYMMASKMKAKQGADFSQIQALAIQEFQKYIQLQHRDNFGVTRIGNVYSYGGNW